MTIFDENTAEAIGFAEGRISLNNSILVSNFQACIDSQDFDVRQVESMQGTVKEIDKSLNYIKSVLDRMKAIANQKRLISENALSESRQRAAEKIKEVDNDKENTAGDC